MFLDDIGGYSHIKLFFRMALNSLAIHTLLEGSPAPAKTKFLTSLMHHVVHPTLFIDLGRETVCSLECKSFMLNTHIRFETARISVVQLSK
jgi:hypothetical protein